MQVGWVAKKWKDSLESPLGCLNTPSRRTYLAAAYTRHVTALYGQMRMYSWQQSAPPDCHILVLVEPSLLVRDCDHNTNRQTDVSQPVSHSRPRRLRSSDSLTCVVRRAHNTYGDRCFATAGPRVWNSLPIELQQCDSLGRFKRCLKTFLFRLWNYGAL